MRLMALLAGLLLLGAAGCRFDTRGLPAGDAPAGDLAPAADRIAAEASRHDAVAWDLPGPDTSPSIDLARLDLARPDLTRPDLAPDLSCSSGATRPCYSGAPGTEGKGECKGGIATCAAGVWGPCQGELTPQSESCDGKDNDCDGGIDDGLSQACPYTGTPASTVNVGLCKAGSQSCSNGVWGSCSGEVIPKPELCDGKDNDCDGKTDEGFSIKCEDITCTGDGNIKTISNLCVKSDGGGSGSSDALEVYCCDGIARFCLSKETCPWRGGCGSAGATTCSRAGLSSDFMAQVTCQEWKSHASYYCSPAGQIYFSL